MSHHLLLALTGLACLLVSGPVALGSATGGDCSPAPSPSFESDTTSSTIVTTPWFYDDDDLSALSRTLETLTAGRPFTWDFRTGCEGWILWETAARVPTSALEGEWAIYAEGSLPYAFAQFPVMEIRFDVAVVSRIEMEVSVLSAFEDSVPAAFLLSIDRLHQLQPIFDPSTNPGLRVFDVSDLSGFALISLRWTQPFDCLWSETCSSTPLQVLIDSVTFVPVPEPSTLLLVLGGLGMGAMGRRRRGLVAGRSRTSEEARGPT